jgi:hypothetical protein
MLFPAKRHDGRDGFFGFPGEKHILAKRWSQESDFNHHHRRSVYPARTLVHTLDCFEPFRVAGHFEAAAEAIFLHKKFTSAPSIVTSLKYYGSNSLCFLCYDQHMITTKRRKNYGQRESRHI